MAEKSLPSLTPVQTALATGLISSGDLPTPFVQEIFLMECHVAGTGYQDLDEIRSRLEEGDLLAFRREPDNKFDKLAIAIFTQDHVKLGYVPKRRNEILARLMDAGKMLFARITEVSEINSWFRIDIEVFMKDI